MTRANEKVGKPPLPCKYLFDIYISMNNEDIFNDFYMAAFEKLLDSFRKALQ